MIFNDFKELETKNGITTYRSLCKFDGGYFYLMKRLYSAAVNEWLGYWVRTNKFDNPALKHTTENTIIFNPPCAMLPSMTPAFGDYSGKSLDYILHRMDDFINFKAISNTASQYLEAESGSLDVYFKFNSIKSVKINKPAVIIFWIDGTKTVAVAKDTEFDPYVGFYVAYAKRFSKTNLNRGIKMLEKEIENK